MSAQSIRSYEDGREKLLNLYEKGKRLRWNANETAHAKAWHPAPVLTVRP
jgi:hypothetical protein